MKKLMFAVAAAVALAAGHSASAQVVATAPAGGCSTCAQGAPAYAGGYAPAYAPSYGYAPAYGTGGFGTGGFGGHLPHLGGGGHLGGSVAGFGGRMLNAHKTVLDRVAFGGGGRGGRGGDQPQGPTMDAAQGGTLVFPQNPYIRSPRDFFMWEGK